MSEQLQLLLAKLEGRPSVPELVKPMTDYLMRTFTYEIAEKICVALQLRNEVDLSNVHDRDIDKLDIIPIHKRILKKLRDQCNDEVLKAMVQSWGKNFIPH